MAVTAAMPADAPHAATSCAGEPPDARSTRNDGTITPMKTSSVRKARSARPWATKQYRHVSCSNRPGMTIAKTSTMALSSPGTNADAQRNSSPAMAPSTTAAPVAARAAARHSSGRLSEYRTEKVSAIEARENPRRSTNAE